MTKRALINIVISAFSVMMIVGAVIVNYVAEHNKNVIKVEITDGETESVEFESLSLAPGESCEYTLIMKTEATGEGTLTFEFSDLAPAKTLKEYACVHLISDGETVYDGKLADALSGGVIETAIDVSGGEQKVTVRYYIPEEIGNEAMNAEASFELLITVHNG